MSTRLPTIMTSFSIAAATGASQTVFPVQRQGEFIERFISNPNVAGSIWINPFGGTAAANAVDCIELVPGALLKFECINQINAITTAANKITAGQR